MKRLEEIRDEHGKVLRIRTSLSGKGLLGNPELNKGLAFTHEERQQFRLLGRLPHHVESMEEQLDRYYHHYQQQSTDLEKNLFLNQLKQNNETLFYHLAREHLAEMLPIIYTPTIGDAVQAFSYEFNLPQGLYISYPNRHYIDNILQNRFINDIDLIIVTDGEGVLGIGDWGIGGMDICIGKLMVYTLCGGINPRRVLPIQLDVGTNNEKLLNDPMYLGWRNERIRGQDYDDYIDLVVSSIEKAFPEVFLHWEDFGRDTARRNLNRYRDKLCTFNDDMQGTGATALASVLSGLQATQQKLKDQRIIFFGAGTAGAGIADQIVREMMIEAGLSEAEARERFWLIDRQGLLIEDMPDLMPFQQPYAKSRESIKNWNITDPKNISLFDVVKNLKPTILIGTSTVHGAFTQDIIETMAAHVDRPIIYPLSNPTCRSEATPKQLIDWTDGRAIIATGSPFDPVTHKGREIRIAQCNNAFIFPGLGLGIIAAKASRVSDGMIAAASRALSDASPARLDPNAPVLPDLDQAQTISRNIAFAVATQARKEGFATISDQVDFKARIDALFWNPDYVDYEPMTEAT